MEKLDIYVRRLEKYQENDLVSLPYVGETRLKTGFIGLELDAKEAYDVYTYLGFIKETDIEIVPAKYRKANILPEEALNTATDFFEKHYVHHFAKEKVHYHYESARGFVFSLDTNQEGCPYVIVDKFDGHIHSKYEERTRNIEEYSLDIFTDLSFDEIESLVLSKSKKKDKTLLAYGDTIKGYVDLYFFDTLYVYIRKSTVPSLSVRRTGFKPNTGITFFIPKYKAGYALGRSEMLHIITSLKEHISRGFVFSHFADGVYVLSIENGEIISNPDWTYF